ncbi:hypothetical protein [Deminuibacter soli]|uniref:Uncharacterized protein n=1 Tax=Deminuibacter soli TaxID=2291815 RepID=A0A3E1NH53_9BACT|nr:hypothetical protein [Deminuibacter soli]RFM27265.1 hypothetical protein DXN05_14630 [Deminuibacter soli]
MAKQHFFIDKITNSIEQSGTGKSFETEVTPLKNEELKLVLKKNGWRFNWKTEYKYYGRSLYKLNIIGQTDIQGLISLQLLENYVEMHLIETAPHNYGHAKLYLGVPANLVAFACKTSYDCGFEGFVAFTAKTRLIQHYMDTLGAELIFRDRMSISGNSAKKLVSSYYKNHFK